MNRSARLAKLFIIVTLFLIALAASNVAFAECLPWSYQVSEENGYYQCPPGYAIAGMKCSGRYCDNKFLQCCSYYHQVDAQAIFDWSPWFSEEKPGYATAQGFVAGIACHGSYCDDIRLLYMRSPLVRNTNQCYQLGPMSEEHFNNVRNCAPGYLVSGATCSGSYCDNIDLRCCRAAVPGDPAYRGQDWLGDRWR